MSKIKILIVFWIIIIALPLTLISIVLTAYINSELIAVSTRITNVGKSFLSIGTDQLFETELLGLLAGLLIIAAILAITRTTTTHYQNNRSI